MYYISYQLLLIILFSYKQQIQKLMQLTQSRKQKIKEARDQINLMLQLSRIKEKLSPVQKTLIIFDIYTEGNQKFLVNLHSIGGALISHTTAILEGKAEEEKYSESKIRYYHLDEQATKESGIKLDQVQLRQENEKNKPSYININLYEGVVQGKNTRVVTIPILKSLQDKQDISQIAKKKKEIQKEYYDKQQKTKGEETQRLQKQCDAKVKQIDQSLVKQFLPKHLKMFIIEALLEILKNKTQKISICQVIPFSIYKDRSKEELSKTALSIFQISPQNIQFIVHSVIKKAIQQIQNKKDIFSGIWTFTGEQQYKITCENSQWFKDSYYTANTEKIRSKMYDTDNKNSSIGKVINMFTKSWSDIVFDSSTCIAPFIKDVYHQLKYEQKLDEHLVTKQKYGQKSFTQSQRENNQQIIIYTFKQIENMYMPKQNGLKEQHKIDFFFNQKRLDGFQLQNKPNPIPDDVGFICFIHFFHKINNQFCDSILTYDKQSSKERLEFILQHIKSVYSLANNINGVDDQYKSSNMSKYFDFLNFLYKAVELIESVTKSTLPITSVIKSFFNKLKQQQNRLLTYIQSNQDKIQPNQELNYYLIYLKILEECSKNAEDSVLQIKLLLNLNKADMISAKYTIYQDKLVQAIKSYCTIISLRNKLPLTKRERFDKMIIQKRIAKLLSICKLHEEALIIFKKNHLVKSVQRCYKDIFLQCDGDERATRHIELGKYLQDQVSFAKAIDNYQCAYEFARTTEKRKEALRAKLDCEARKKSTKQENELNIQRFLSGQITEEQFDNIKKAGDFKSQGDNLFETLMNKLVIEKNKCKILE